MNSTNHQHLHGNYQQLISTTAVISSAAAQVIITALNEFYECLLLNNTSQNRESGYTHGTHKTKGEKLTPGSKTDYTQNRIILFPLQKENYIPA
jgi:hypothetical protein